MGIRFVIYGLLPRCVEIIWSAVSERLEGKQDDWHLLGHISRWMFSLDDRRAPRTPCAFPLTRQPSIREDASP